MPEGWNLLSDFTSCDMLYQSPVLNVTSDKNMEKRSTMAPLHKLKPSTQNLLQKIAL
jgi:hypothetical protein